MLNVRPSPIAGTWYPGSPEALARSVDAQLNAAPADPIPGEVVAVIAPHAGHRYSGEVAATAFRTLKGAERSPVAVVSPMHHPYPGQVLTSGHSAYGPRWARSRSTRNASAGLRSRCSPPAGYASSG